MRAHRGSLMAEMIAGIAIVSLVVTMASVFVADAVRLRERQDTGFALDGMMNARLERVAAASWDDLAGGEPHRSETVDLSGRPCRVTTKVAPERPGLVRVTVEAELLDDRGERAMARRASCLRARRAGP